MSLNLQTTRLKNERGTRTKVMVMESSHGVKNNSSSGHGHGKGGRAGGSSKAGGGAVPAGLIGSRGIAARLDSTTRVMGTVAMRASTRE